MENWREYLNEAELKQVNWGTPAKKGEPGYEEYYQHQETLPPDAKKVKRDAREKIWVPHKLEFRRMRKEWGAARRAGASNKELSRLGKEMAQHARGDLQKWLEVAQYYRDAGYEPPAWMTEHGADSKDPSKEREDPMREKFIKYAQDRVGQYPNMTQEEKEIEMLFWTHRIELIARASGGLPGPGSRSQNPLDKVKPQIDKAEGLRKEKIDAAWAAIKKGGAVPVTRDYWRYYWDQKGEKPGTYEKSTLSRNIEKYMELAAQTGQPVVFLGEKGN